MSPVFASQIHYVREFRKIRIAIDVSGSMGFPVTTRRDLFGKDLVWWSIASHPWVIPDKFPGTLQRTRWEELREQLKLLFDICTEHELVERGVDVFFIHDPQNGSGLKDRDEVRSWEELEELLPRSPAHGTPTIATVERMFEPWRMVPEEEKLLTMIFTDGEPTDGRIGQLKASLEKKQNQFPNSYITIVLCTDNEVVVNSFNQLDKSAPGLDVMDDYYSERAEILQKQGAGFQFSREDYAIKLVLGSMIELWDRLDERKLTADEARMFKEYGKKWDWDGRKTQGEQKKKKTVRQRIASALVELLQADDG
jgi:hypothetical protein